MPPDPTDIEHKIDITKAGYESHGWEVPDGDHLWLYLYTNNAGCVFRGEDIDLADDHVWFDNFEKHELAHVLSELVLDDK